jgi:TPP-dependent pyruvate/acetoin dehydrogenase alpha subunit
MVERGAAFGIRTAEIDSTDVLALRDFGREVVGAVRGSGRPLFAVVHTHRLCAHSKGDDTRPPEAVAALCAHDPLTVHGARLARAEREAAEAWAGARIDAALAAVAPGLVEGGP